MPPPPRPKLTEEEQAVIYNWIALGAPENATEEDKTSNPRPAEPQPVPKHISEVLRPYFNNPERIDYETVSKHVFSTSCTSCHSENGSKSDDEAINFGVNLTSYEDMFFSFVGSPIVKGSPEQSLIFEVINIKQTMPPTRQGYRLMDPYRSKLLRLWILNCAIEDYESLSEDSLGPNR